MPATIGTTSGSVKRTYSRRNSAKRRQSIDQTIPEKRRKLSEDRDLPCLTDTEQDNGTDEPEASPSRIKYTYGTPKRSSKSSQEIFSSFNDMTPKSSPLPTPTKLAKRMLSRSKTDTRVVGNSTASIERTSSLPNMPTSPARPPFSTSVTQPDPIPARPLAKPSNTRTYAGRSRSFLVELPKNDLSSIGGGDDELTRESYESLRSRWGVDNSEDDPYPVGSPTRSVSSQSTPRKNGKGKGKARQAVMDLAPGMMNPLKSITELRNKGESRRFLDEVGYLFEGLDINGGIGLKRASALEITTKLCDMDFFRKAKAADFFHKTWEVFIEAGSGRGEDRILDTLLIFFTALVSREPSSLTDLAQRSAAGSDDSEDSVGQTPLVATLFRLLDCPDPLPAIGRTVVEADLKKMGIGKKERQMLNTMYECISSKSRLFPRDTPVSAPLLIYRTLQTLPASLIPINHLPTVLSSKRTLLHALLFPNQSSVSPYLGWPDAAQEMPYQTAYYQLRMLDQYLLGQWGDVDVTGVEEQNQEREAKRVKKSVIKALNEAREDWFVGCLVGLLVCCELHSGSATRGCIEIALRVLVSLTHADEEWARKALECEYALGCVLRLVLRSWKDARAAQQRQSSADGDWKSKGKERMKREMDNKDRDAESDDEGSEAGVDGGGEEEEEENKAVGAVDRLCLALGVLTNLVQTVEGAKDSLREISLNQDCDLTKRSCILRCTCTSPVRKDKAKSTVNGLDVLVQIYHAQQQPIKSEPDTVGGETTDTLFLRGHLSVLFGLLMQGCPANQTYLLQSLTQYPESRNSKQEILSALVDEAHSFAIFCASLGNAGLNVNANTNGDVDEEGRVAREVVRFLEGLRDRCDY